LLRYLIYMTWTAAIVAGGSARRLDGRDKSALAIGGRSILERQLAAIRPLTDRILVVANDPGRVAGIDLRVVGDLVPGAGALGGIYTALAVATTDRVLVIACDMPFITDRFLAFLTTVDPEAALVIPHPRDGYQPLCAVYSQACRDALARRLADGALRVQDLAADVRTREIGPDELAPFDPDGTLFFNLNTPEDYQRAQHLAVARDPQPDRP
jgi:molybdopterin-guanine dinucleotide biosynthesis protein A